MSQVSPQLSCSTSAEGAPGKMLKLSISPTTKSHDSQKRKSDVKKQWEREEK